MTSPIRRATSADIVTAAATLAAAFDAYPWTRWSIPKDGYADRLERLQAIYLAHAMQHGVVLITEDLAGVAAIVPPGTPELPDRLQAEIAELMGDRLAPMLAAELPPRPDDSWDFATVGVHPEHAGRGLGSALITEALSCARESTTPRMSLETSSLSNVALYERHGFTTRHRTEIERGPVVFTMAIEL